MITKKRLNNQDDHIKKYKREYYQKHKKIIRRNSKKYYKQNKKKLREYGSIYYQKHKNECNRYGRNSNLKRRFGFIPRLYLHNKNVTSDGCFLGNSNVIKVWRPSTFTKSIILYKHEDCYKIQVVIPNEEFWFRLYTTETEAKRFFDKLRHYPYNALKYLEKEEKNG